MIVNKPVDVSWLTTASISVAVIVILLGWKKGFPPRKLSAQGKSILVTGCDTGFGNLLTHVALRAGFKVIAACYTQDGAAQLCKSSDNDNVSLTTVVADLSTTEGLDKVVSAVKAGCEPGTGLYALVNNAGVCFPGFIFWLAPKRFEETMKVNFFAPVSLTYELLPLLKQCKGRVINVTSVEGFTSLPGTSSYAASKHALEAFSDCLRCEMSQWGVKVVVIEPSNMRTPIALQFADGFLKTFMEAPKDRQRPFGDEWIQESHKSIKEIILQSAMDPMVTVNDLMDALLLENPPTRILSGFLAKVLYKPMNFLPDKLKDIAVSQLITPLPCHLASEAD